MERKQERVWISRYKWIPAEKVSRVFEKDGDVIIEDRDGECHSTHKPDISYVVGDSAHYEREEETVAPRKDDATPFPAAVRSVFEKQWKQTGTATSAFMLAGAIHHLIKEGAKRKGLAVSFIRMKEAGSAPWRAPDVATAEEIANAASTLAVIMSINLKGAKYCIK